MSEPKFTYKFFKKWLQNQQCELDEQKKRLDDLELKYYFLLAKTEGILFGLRLVRE